MPRDYLSRYLTPSAPQKKRKRSKPSSSGLTITEDDAEVLFRAQPDDIDPDEDAVVVGDVIQEKKKAKWLNLSDGTDKILAEAERERKNQQDDEDPVVVEEPAAGLMTGKEHAALLKRKRGQEIGIDALRETVYRDASGRIVNLAEKRDEMREKAAEEKRREVERQQGEVQKQLKEDRRRELEEVKTMGVARYADDKRMNEELKAQERWNDPMAGLVRPSGRREKKVYKGAFEPNRYGIKPGWKWDGVDRGNGFERKWFAARNGVKERKERMFNSLMDD
ncbi:hypothetical protein K470DRAFT_209877 [Piedraia hortae CBS 480.64]|uniref:Pre-mRNA-splicing factor CWC26 n=1 Tax=Piedraia hortae CBS 480.64 TaxID=1314780 RepID=A0A6A7CBI9_9PEZI|nr:hypothetical protein K470DRAFT_209877 [Piedraia hortae CBS 480.64]